MARMTQIWTIGDSAPVDSPKFVQSCYESVTPYVEGFLTALHPYRNGVMCPFMPKALAEKNIYFTYFDSKDTDQRLQHLIGKCINFYKSRPNTSFGAVIILFEQDFDILRLLRMHIDAKANCIKNELMIGALYKDSQAPSLHSADYFPLRTPTPTLVLRDLTAQDLQFLNPGHYGVISKLKFLNSFIKKFSTPDMKGHTKIKVTEAIMLRRRHRLTLAVSGFCWSLVALGIIGFTYYRWAA
ncbi:DUF6875 domain-containing protein [Pseudomonas sp. GD03867]|uniref:DUF6875 domain-containing protein n=2 Tax=unclassified Pseudomonas TaxID=196821 RepID=UPI0032653696